MVLRQLGLSGLAALALGFGGACPVVAEEIADSNLECRAEMAALAETESTMDANAARSKLILCLLRSNETPAIAAEANGYFEADNTSRAIRFVAGDLAAVAGHVTMALPNCECLRGTNIVEFDPTAGTHETFFIMKADPRVGNLENLVVAGATPVDEDAAVPAMALDGLLPVAGFEVRTDINGQSRSCCPAEFNEVVFDWVPSQHHEVDFLVFDQTGVKNVLQNLGSMQGGFGMGAE